MSARESVHYDQVLRLWFQQQGLTHPRATVSLGKRALVAFLERTGGLQLDSVNVVDRAHWLTLWSRFGAFDRRKVERFVYTERAAFDYWGHEACILPISHLPEARRRMKRIPEIWAGKAWWQHFKTSTGSRRRVLRRLREEGPLESSDFERGANEVEADGGWGAAMPKEDKRTLQFLWHSGRVAVAKRRHFRRVYDLESRVYPDVPAATRRQEEDAWLLRGLTGNGIATEAHLVNYLTAAGLKAPKRREVIDRNLRTGRVVPVDVDGLPAHATGGKSKTVARNRWLALPDHLEDLDRIPSPSGTNLLSPFDSFLWQRDRAESLLDFRYRIEIYIPAAKREYGYYVMPILHDGQLVGRLDPKFHRDRKVLEVRKLQIDSRFKKTATGRDFESGLKSSLHDLAGFLGADGVQVPGAWRKRLT